MADIQEAIVVSGIHTNIIDPVDGKSKNYKEVTTWWDGTPMDNSKVDGTWFRRKGTTYLRQVIDKEGELFLEKDTVSQLRALSPLEILFLRGGVYKGVRLNGYYSKGDTPAPIEYILSDTVESDDGGSVFEVGGIKLEHEFIGEVDIRYFGSNDESDISDILLRLNTLNKVSAAIIPENSTYFLSKRIDLTKLSIIGGTNSVLKVTSNNIVPLWLSGYSNNVIKNLILDSNNSENNSNSTFIMLTGSSENNSFENLSFINISSFSNIPSSPPLYLIAKDEEDDMGQGDIGFVRNNTFKNIKFEQMPNYKSAFVIRAVTNWTKTKPTETIVNKCEFNTFEKIHITGDYLWNMIELAGTGTVNNIVRDSYFKGRAITAIDLDKGASDNIVENNYVELSLSSYHEEAESPFMFAAINNHGSSGLVNYNNVIRNNKLNNCGLLHTNLSPLEACIGFQYVNGGSCVGNKILNTHNSVCGIHFLSNVENLEISNNISKNVVSRALTVNANQGGIHNNKIINNIFESDNNVIFLAGVTEENNNNLISGNSLICVEGSNGGIWVASAWSNIQITNNYIYNTGDKIVLSGCSRPIVSENILNGTSPFSIRTTATNESIINNVSVVSTSGLVGSSANTARQWNNSWNPRPVEGSPYYRNDNITFGQDASVVPEGFWTSSKSITMSTISSGVGFPEAQGLLITYQNGGGATAGNYGRTFDIFKSYNNNAIYIRRYSTSAVPQAFIRIDNVNASVSVKGLVNQAAASPDTAEQAAGATPTKEEFDALLAELRDLKTKARAAGILAT